MKYKLLILSLFITTSSFAEFKITSMDTTAKVVASCSVSVDNISFGLISSGAGDVNVTGSIYAKCSKGVNYTIGFNNGSSKYHNKYIGTLPTTDKWNYQGFARFMSNTESDDYLVYQLFQDANHSIIYGVGSTWTTTTIPLVNKVGNGSQDIIPIYGVMTQGQFPKPGVYSDTLIATLTY